MSGGELMSSTFDTREGKRLKKWFREECQAADLPCWLCGQPIDWSAEPQTQDAFEPDHFHPQVTHPELALDPENLRCSHVSCNRSRQANVPAPSLGSLSEAW